jgi:hypothetical protein
MTRFRNSLAACAICLAVTGCGETKFLDTMGLGKNAPDETRVQRNSDLAMPPDLQLRTPSNAPVPEPQPGPTPVSSLSQPPDPAAGNVAGDVTGSLGTTGEGVDAGVEPSTAATAPTSTTATTGPAPTTVTPAVPPAAAGTPRENALAKYGISKTHPDGRPKSEGELNQELLAAMKAEKQRQDPNYGTIFNMGGLFSGWRR